MAVRGVPADSGVPGDGTVLPRFVGDAAGTGVPGGGVVVDALEGAAVPGVPIYNNARCCVPAATTELCATPPKRTQCC